MTPTEVARSRYNEAHAIKEAWGHRLAKAQRDHREAVRDGGDAVATKRQLAAVEIEHDDAVEQCRIAQNEWIENANWEFRPRRRVA